MSCRNAAHTAGLLHRDVRVGGVRQLTFPRTWGTAPRAAPDIGPNETLEFSMELLAVG